MKVSDIKAPWADKYRPMEPMPGVRRDIVSSGVQVPRATDGGVPEGVPIHDLKDVPLVIDPFVQGVEPAVVRIGDIDPEKIEREWKNVVAELGEKSRRMPVWMIGGEVMARLSVPDLLTPREAGTEEKPAISDRPAAPAGGKPVQASRQKRRSVRSVSPLAAFEGGGTPAKTDSASPETRVRRSREEVRVVFEVRGLGQAEAIYHDAIVVRRDDGTAESLVLVFDHGAMSSVCYRPAKETSLAVLVEGVGLFAIVPTVYFVYDDLEYLVFAVEREADLPEEE